MSDNKEFDSFGNPLKKPIQVFNISFDDVQVLENKQFLRDYYG